MKGRSHRIPSHEMHEDWVDGSWTVDCVCGVNFDDGEEMVNCDECGVWVHTRCSRYVKGEELFACDKCKSKNNKDESEETEVAQLLVELPTKTIRLESSYAATGPARHPFRLWADIPMEERVHVQGIPGGDPALFTGLSVFTPELWKCAGYVPKKFNFQYREFPCWDEEDCKNEEDHENTVDKGAGVLFSLAKETILATPAAALVGMRERTQEGTLDRKGYSEERKAWVKGDGDVWHSQKATNERSLLRPIVIQSNKRKKEDLGMSKERSGKKKARTMFKEVDAKKRVSHVSRTASTSTSDAKPLDFYEDRRSKSIKNDSQSTKSRNQKASIEYELDYHVSGGNSFDKSKNSIAVLECSSENLCVEVPRVDFPIGDRLDERKGSHEGLEMVESSSKFDSAATSAPEHIDVGRTPIEQEGDIPNGCPDNNLEGSVKCDVKPPTDGLASTVSEAKDNQMNSENPVFPNSLQPDVNVDADGSSSRVLNGQSCAADAKDTGVPHDDVSENLKANKEVLSSSPSADCKTQETNRTPEAVADYHEGKNNELSKEGSEVSTPLQKCSSEPKLGSTFAKELSKLGENTSNSSASPCQSKIVVCLGKSSSSSATVTITKSSVNDTARSADNQDSNPNIKQQVTLECNSSNKKDRAAVVAIQLKDEDTEDISRKTAKERPKSAANSVSKLPNSSKISRTSSLKRAVSDSKDSAHYPSTKTSVAQNSSEAAGPLQHGCFSHVQNKGLASGLLRGEKFSHSNSQPSSKGNHASSINPPPSTNSSATLSDEELALLLHQELNSSPRVPRVPRVRHAGTLPQLTSPTATSMLIKCTSSSARDHSSVSRRKNKDAFKDGFSRSHELDDEKMDRGPSSSSLDLGRQDTGCTADELLKREDNGSPGAVNSVKKNNPFTSASTVNSGPSSPTEINDQHLSSVRNSPRNMSDEEAGTVRGVVQRTLPGLISEIMSKGKRMTYEELCNAVLPHWHNLRKHNGERYAYSSHSQAVLDCLRNRHEWAQLVDRGPKTNSSRKRRKVDAEDSEDNDYGKRRATKEGVGKSLESQRDEFPKGKRKARKRRRLSFQGRGIKVFRSKRKADLPSDDDSGPFSNSSDESLFSEDEIRGGGGGPVGSEASTSSDEAGTA